MFGRILYNLGIRFYNFIILLVSPFNEKASHLIKGRKETVRLLNEIPEKKRKRIWIHCASLGEFEQGRPVIETLNKKCEIILTFFSPSGYNIRKNYTGADYIFYILSDTKSNANLFIDRAKPDLAIFVKYEFWLNYLGSLKDNGVPVLSISAIFRENQFFFRRSAAFYLSALKDIDKIFVQDKKSLDLLNNNGFENAALSGDTRFDRVKRLSKTDFKDDLVEKFCGTDRVFIAGSSWSEDMELLVPLINENSEKIKFIIAPHKIDQNEIDGFIDELSGTAVKYSDNPEGIIDARVLFIDNVGMLAQLYSYGHFAYVGGAFGEGLHSIAEPAAYGLPVFFGNKNYKKFREANDLIKLKGAFTVGNFTELKKTFNMLQDEKKWLETSQICKNYVHESTGASKIISDYVEKTIQA